VSHEEAGCRSLILLVSVPCGHLYSVPPSVNASIGSSELIGERAGRCRAVDMSLTSPTPVGPVLVLGLLSTRRHAASPLGSRSPCETAWGARKCAADREQPQATQPLAATQPCRPGQLGDEKAGVASARGARITRNRVSAQAGKLLREGDVDLVVSESKASTPSGDRKGRGTAPSDRFYRPLGNRWRWVSLRGVPEFVARARSLSPDHLQAPGTPARH